MKREVFSFLRVLRGCPICFLSVISERGIKWLTVVLRRLSTSCSQVIHRGGKPSADNLSEEYVTSELIGCCGDINGNCERISTATVGKSYPQGVGIGILQEITEVMHTLGIWRVLNREGVCRGFHRRNCRCREGWHIYGK